MQIKVEAASVHEQSLEDAPASVSIITQDEIRKYGYRTLAEALSSARGLYTASDRSFIYGGVRGFSLPGDFGERFLVMVNGALYGTSGIFLTINVVTFSSEELNASEVRAEVGSLGEKKFQATACMSLGHRATLLLSGSLFNDTGQCAIDLPEDNSPATN